MIGTEKQIAYAKDVIAGAKALAAHHAQAQRGQYWADRLAAIELIEAIDEQRWSDAMTIMDSHDIPGWVTGEYVIAASDGKGGWSRNRDIERIEDAVVVAGMVIDALKKDYYSAKELGLI